jgi:hypothetical protein
MFFPDAESKEKAGQQAHKNGLSLASYIKMLIKLDGSDILEWIDMHIDTYTFEVARIWHADLDDGLCTRNCHKYSHFYDLMDEFCEIIKVYGKVRNKITGGK